MNQDPAYLSNTTTCRDLLEAPRRPSDAILAALRGDICRILQTNFREFSFHALECIRQEAEGPEYLDPAPHTGTLSVCRQGAAPLLERQPPGGRCPDGHRCATSRRP